MAGRYPKSDSERRTRHKPQFEWVNLPAEGRKGPAPKVPAWRVWHPETKKWWKDLWAKPQAVMWDQSGATLHPLLCLYDDLISARTEVAKVSGEMRQHEDRHGLNPKAMLQLRWRIVPDELEEVRKPDARPRLRAVDGES